MSGTLLTYAVETNPDPIQVSPEKGDPPLTTLTIVASNDTHQMIDCQSISFGFLQGTDAKDLFSDSTGIGTSPPAGWTLTQDGALFTATPDTPSDGQVGADGLTFVLSNLKVNQQVGATDLTVTEVTSSNTGTQEYQLAKFPPQFEVGQLQVNPPPPLAPGSSVTLIWSGSSANATYELQYLDENGNTVTITHVKGEPDQPLPATGSYTIDDLQIDTTFYLIVTVQVPGQEQGLTVERFFPVVVTPLQPAITLFEGKVEVGTSGWELILNWETTNADYCTIAGDANQLNPSSTDDSYHIALTPYSSSGTTCTLTAKNSVGHDTSEITVEWQFQQTASVQAGGNVSGIAESPDGTRFYVANFYMPGYNGGNLRVFDAHTMAPIGDPITVGVETAGVAPSPDGTLLYVVSSFDGNLWVLNAETLQFVGNPVPLGGARNGVSDIAISPDGTRLYVTNMNDGTVKVLDAQTLQPVGSPVGVPGGFVTSISASPDGKHLYVVGGSNTVLCLDAVTLQQVGASGAVGSQGSGAAAVSAEGARVYFVNYPDSTLWILDAHALQPIGGTVSLPMRPTAIGVSTIKPCIYVGGEGGALYVFSNASVSGGKTPPPLGEEWVVQQVTMSWRVEKK